MRCVISSIAVYLDHSCTVPYDKHYKKYPFNILSISNKHLMPWTWLTLSSLSSSNYYYYILLTTAVHVLFTMFKINSVIFLPLYQPSGTLQFRTSASAYKKPTGQPLFRGQLPMQAVDSKAAHSFLEESQWVIVCVCTVCLCVKEGEMLFYTLIFISVLILSCPSVDSEVLSWAKSGKCRSSHNNNPSAALFPFPPHFSFLFLFLFVIQHIHTLPVSGQGSNQTPDKCLLSTDVTSCLN